MKTSAEPIIDPFLRKRQDDLRWAGLCKKYLPCEIDGSIWRFNRSYRDGEPSQGWKLHVSATVLDACDLFQKIAPLLQALDVQFKGPTSLFELARINSGLHFGYSQVGKFLTIYPATTERAVYLAKKLHQLTGSFASPAVPFDERFLPGSCVHYRYGAFRSINRMNADGETESCIRNAKGELVPDNRLQPVPDWLSDPFKLPRPKAEKHPSKKTPLNTNYQIIRALTQRGKGGVYLAMDLSMKMPRLCIIKEGRRNGELNWAGLDGYDLIANEHLVLSELGKTEDSVPQVFSSFEMDGNYYLIMEYVEGESLSELLKTRRRRLSLKRSIRYSSMIAGIIERFHSAGWIWTDCKPANLIVTPLGDLRPVDFEGAHSMGKLNRFCQQTLNFSIPYEHLRDPTGKAADLYSLGTVMYFLLTGKFFHYEDPVPIKTLRRDVPKPLQELIGKLVDPRTNGGRLSASRVRGQLEKISLGLDQR